MLVNQRYRCQFDGNSLIFIIWLILLVLPLFDSIEGYGFKIKKDRISQEKQSKDIQTLTEDMVNRTNHPSIADLKQQLENLQSNNNEQL